MAVDRAGVHQVEGQCTALGLSDAKREPELRGRVRVVLEGDLECVPTQGLGVGEARSREVEIDLGLRKQLRADIDLIQLKIKLANIGLMPLLVILFGIGFFIRKRKKTAAI